MTLETIWAFVRSFCVLFFVAFIFSRLRIIKRHLTTKPDSMKDKLILALLFGALGCIGSGIGVEFNGSLVNTRVIGVAVGGLVGGPFVGILSGAIAGLHRVCFVSAGQATAVACGISMVFEGAFAGYLSRYSGKFNRLWELPVITVVFCEIFRKAVLLAVIKPYELAVMLVESITVPMIVINSLGVALFISFIEAVSREQERVKANQSEIVLAMTEKIAASFKQGLVRENLTDVVRTIEENTDFTHVAISGTNGPIISNRVDATCFDLSLEQAESRADAPHRISAFEANGVHFIAAPLTDDTETAGLLILGKDTEPSVYDFKLAEGLGKLFSTQLTIGNLEYRSSLLKEAEIKVLQTQISPHFLFNSLTVISSLCRTDPTKARSVIDHLADFYRRNLRINAQFVSLRDEIEHIEAYLEIIKARHASKIDIRYDIDRQLECYLPPLSLQPLVENSIKHGLLPKRGGGTISIRAHRAKAGGAVKIEVEDDGKGFDPTAPHPGDSNRIGLDNVRKRLRNCFGDDLTWEIRTRPNEGTRVTIIIPALSGA